MSYDMEFEEAACRISDRMYVISDPQLVVTVEKWLTKLTSENRGPNELNYLKLLQYMIENKWLSRPFVKPPPAGPLLPLSRYINPPPCGGRSGPRRQDPVTDKWTVSKSTRAAQAMDSEPSNCDRSDSDSDSDFFGYADANVDDVSTTTVTSTNENDNANADDGGGNVSANDGNNANADDGGGRSEDADEAANRAAHTERDGHLAGGGGGGKRCGSWGMNGGDGGAKAVKLCDVCLDGLGRHLKKPAPGPLDGAYEELLGDCVIPVLTEAEKQSVNPNLLKVLENVNDATSLQDYYGQVGTYTCDQATLMMKSAEGMVEDFRKFVADVLESRAEHISDGLAKEQTALCNKYAYFRDRMMNRATVALDFLREALPVFDWYKYRDDPETYMKRSILRPVPPPVTMPSSETAPASAAGATATSSAASASGVDAKDGKGGTVDRAAGNDTEPKKVDDNGTAGVDHNDDDGDDEEEDEDGGVQQSASKKLMYSLNWLRAEVARTECDGQRLHEQRKSLAACLAETDCRLSEIKCQSTATVDQLKDELAVLRQRSSEQTYSIDRLMESISLIMENKQQPTDATDC